MPRLYFCYNNNSYLRIRIPILEFASMQIITRSTLLTTLTRSTLLTPPSIYALYFQKAETIGISTSLLFVKIKLRRTTINFRF